MGRAQLKTLAEVIMKKAIPSVNAELNADPLIFPPALVPLVRYISIVYDIPSVTILVSVHK
jgi:hypothetical protein